MKTPSSKGKDYTESTQKEKSIRNSQMNDDNEEDEEDQEENEIEIVEGDEEGEECHQHSPKMATVTRNFGVMLLSKGLISTMENVLIC